jgi:hypothetical protein
MLLLATLWTSQVISEILYLSLSDNLLRNINKKYTRLEILIAVLKYYLTIQINSWQFSENCVQIYFDIIKEMSRLRK